MLSTDQLLNKGRYRIVGNFSHDAAGVYEAYDSVSQTNVVVKETIGDHGVETSLNQLESINNTFIGRARTLCDIKHNSLLRVQDYFADIDRQYLVFENVNDTDIARFVGSSGQRPDMADVLRWIDQLLDALHVLHTQATPLIHGDINPRNVKLDASSNVKLMPGWSQASKDETNIAAERPSDQDANYKPLEQLWETLDHLSQRVILNQYDEQGEKWLLKPLNASSDLYSVGATIYAVLTGVIPPDALDRSIAEMEGKPDPLRDPSEINLTIPHEISEVILKAMALRREERFYSAVILRQTFRTADVRVKERLANLSGLTAEAEEKPAAKIDTVAEPSAQNAAEVTLPKREDPEGARQLAKRILAEKEASVGPTAGTMITPEKKLAEATNDLLEIPFSRRELTEKIKAPVVMDDIAFLNSPAEPKTRSRLPLTAVISAVLLAGVAGGIYKFASASFEVQPSPAATQLSAAPVVEPTVTTPAPTVDTPLVPPVTAASMTEQTLSESSSPHERTTKPVQNPPVDKTKKPPAATTAKTQAPKKQLTVDDLINDH